MAAIIDAAGSDARRESGGATSMLGSLKRGAKTVFSNVATAVMGDEHGRIMLATRRGPARGLRFRLDLKTRLEYAYWFGTYDLNVLEALAGVCRPGWTAWDCGTYLGFYTVFFARLVGPCGHVIAFEPDPRNLERTRQNIALNSMQNVRLEHLAIADHCGECHLLMSDNTNSHLPGRYVGTSEADYAKIERVDSILPVPCTTLDSYYEHHGIKPDVIKIDIEGAEKTALAHTTRLCREVRPLIVLELHNRECDQAAWTWALRSDYRLASLETGEIITSASRVLGTLLCSPAERCIPHPTA